MSTDRPLNAASAEATDFIATAFLVTGLLVVLLGFTGLREPANEWAYRWYDTYGGRQVGRDPWSALDGNLSVLLGTMLGVALIRYARPLSRKVWRDERPIQIGIVVSKEHLLCLALSVLGVAIIARAVAAIAHLGSQHLWAWPGMGRGIFFAASIAAHLFLGGFLLLFAYYAFLGAWLVSWLRWEPTRLKLPEEIVGGVVLEVAAAVALIRWARPIAAILGTEDSEADSGSSWAYLRIERTALTVMGMLILVKTLPAVGGTAAKWIAAREGGVPPSWNDHLHVVLNVLLVYVLLFKKNGLLRILRRRRGPYS